MSKQTKILYMCDNNLSTVGGEQQSSNIILEGLQHDFELAVVQPGEVQTRIKSVKYFIPSKKTSVKRIIRNPAHFLAYINSIRRIINESEPAIVHTQSQVSFFIVALLRKLRLLNGAFCLIHTDRGLYVKYSKFFQSIFRFLMPELDTLVTTTKFNRMAWKEALTSKRYRINYVVIENTAGDLFNEQMNATQENQLRVANNSGSFTVGFSGRYRDWKNWPLAIAVVKALDEKYGSRLRVRMAVGSLHRSDTLAANRMFDELKSALGQRFYGEINVPIKKMREFYDGIDFFILTSWRNTESFGRTIVEAMARGKIVISTDAGGPPEVIDNPRNIQDSVDGFVSAITYYLDNPNAARQERKRGSVRVRTVYSQENNIKKHRDLYYSILGQRQGLDKIERNLSANDADAGNDRRDI